MIKSKGKNRNRVEDVGVISQKKEEQKGKTLKEQRKPRKWARANKGPTSNHPSTHR